MRITVMYFSPSGNTADIAERIRKSMIEGGAASVQMIDLSRSGYFATSRKGDHLRDIVEPHDLLVVGAPVYAHHLQYHMKDVIRMLPRPGGVKWGKTAMAFVTYGGISSGIALEEAGKLLRQSGRSVGGGLKISSPHRMTRAFMEKEYRAEVSDQSICVEITRMTESALKSDQTGMCDILPKLAYQPRIKKVIADVAFNEKKWHASRYPKVRIDGSSCNGCGNCVKICPVLRIRKGGQTAVMEGINDCIHCLNCMTACPSKAVYLEGNLEKGRAFMEKIIRKNGGKELPAVYYYS